MEKILFSDEIKKFKFEDILKLDNDIEIYGNMMSNEKK